MKKPEIWTKHHLQGHSPHERARHSFERKGTIDTVQILGDADNEATLYHAMVDAIKTGFFLIFFIFFQFFFCENN